VPTPLEKDSERPSRQRGSSECKPLIDAATKDLFRKNAFRIMGLSVDATIREIAKHADKIKILAELGQDPHTQDVAFPMKPPPSLDEIREAIQKLKEPEKRLIDEFFWFWPGEFGNGQSDPAMQALGKGDSKTSIEIWAARENDEDSGIIAKHNLALVYHIWALDWANYSVGNEVEAEPQQKITDYWKESFNRWERLATDERFWEILTTRIRQSNEPNLTTGFARRMRATLPEALGKINAELALAFAESGKIELARLHIQFMRETNQGLHNVEKTAELVLTPARNRLKEQIQRARKRADENPREAANAARELLEQARSTLALFDLFFGKASDVRNELFDEVARLCNQLPVAYQEATGDDKTCLELLKSILPFATSTELRQQIEKNISTLARNIETARKNEILYGGLTPISSAPSLRTMNGIGFTLYGSTDLEPTTGSYLCTYYFVLLAIPVFPICRYRVTRSGNSYRFLGKAPLRPCDKWHLAISVGLILSLIIILISSGNESAISNTTTYSAPSPAPHAPAFSEEDFASPHQFTGGDFKPQPHANTVPANTTVNPFDQFEKPTSPAVVAFPPLNLQGLNFNGAKSFAILNGATVGIGERIGPVRVLAVDRDRVTVELNGQTKVLILGAIGARGANSGGNTYRVPSSVSATLDGERAVIESDRATLAALETQIEKMGREIETDRLYLDRTRQFAVDEFNAKVGRFNALAQKAKIANAAFNQKVDNFNTKLRQYAR
jgi:hypothetical protein